MYKHTTRLLAMVVSASLIMLVGLLIFTKEASGAGPYTVPQLSLLNATIPANLLADQIQIKCLVRVDQNVTKLYTRSACYQAEDPDPMPPPPYQAGFEHVVVNTTLNQSTGQIVIPYFPCQVVVPGVLAVGTNLNIQLSKSGGMANGTIVLTIDTTSPWNCADGAQVTGQLTAIPLPINHKQDGDSCPDYKELGSDPRRGGDRDPFNPYDFYDVIGWDYVNWVSTPPEVLIDVMDTQNKAFRIWSQAGDPIFDKSKDRSKIGPDPWDLGPPDGVINWDDLNAVQGQHGHDCR